MNIVEKPLSNIRGLHLKACDGVNLVAVGYGKGTRLDTHMHREAQLVYAAKGTMQVTTPKGRWLVPPDRAVWVPARLEHAIDVLADIEMRTLYFDLAWLTRETPRMALDAEFVVRVSRLLHQAILALFDGRDDPVRTNLLIRLAMLELHQAEDPATFIPLPHEPRCRRAADIVLADPTQVYDIDELARTVGTSSRTLSRRIWMPISPYPYLDRIKGRRVLLVYARYDLTFPVDLSRMLVAEFRRRGIDHELVVLPCGHYSTGVTPFKWLDGLTLCRFLSRNL